MLTGDVLKDMPRIAIQLDAVCAYLTALTSEEPANIPEIRAKTLSGIPTAIMTNIFRFIGSALTIVVLLTSAGRTFAQTSSDIDSITAELRSRDYEQALQLARSSLQQSPNDAKVLTLEGLALSGLDKPREALTSYNAALKISPDYLPALEGAAQIEYKADSNRASALLNRILKIRPDDPTAHAMLGVISYKDRHCKQAVEHFRASGQLIYSQRAALEQYGFCLVSLGQVQDAIPLYQAVLSQAPGDETAGLHVAAAQILADQPKDAIATLQPLLAKEDVSSKTLDLAATAYEKSGDTPRAVELLRKAIVITPDDPKLYLDFSTLCFDHSSFNVGIDMLNAGLQRLPRAAPLYLARGILYIQLAMYDKGEADFETAERLDPRQTFSSESESLAKMEQNRGDDALATVRARLNTHPNDPVLLYFLADALTREGAQPGSPEFKEALSAVSRAVLLKPDFTLAHDLLGSLYFKEGEMGKAIEQCRVALRADPKDEEALYRLIQALRKSGNTSETAELLKRLADLREEDRNTEAARNRYKLVEPNAAVPPASSAHSQ